MRAFFAADFEIFENLGIALENFYGIPALLLGRKTVNTRLFDIGKRMLDLAREGVGRNCRLGFCRLNGNLCGFEKPLFL